MQNRAEQIAFAYFVLNDSLEDDALLYEQIPADYLNWWYGDQSSPAPKVDKRKDYDLLLKKFRIWRACMAVSVKHSLPVYANGNAAAGKQFAVDVVAEAEGDSVKNIIKAYKMIQSYHRKNPHIIIHWGEPEAKLKHWTKILKAAKVRVPY